MHTSPKKLFAAADRLHSPIKSSQAVKASRSACSREQKRSFERRKHGLADAFLRELDEKVTGGRIGKMTAASGGVAVRWTNKLNTTAGRATWKRETIRSRTLEDQNHNQDGVATVGYMHHAAIEIAEKVIDDEHRLLNVMAHEFCHLATFIIDGVSANPHGKEFKAWASKCTNAFAPRGVQVTTKHSYDIAYKYVWACADCAIEYKRHSKSIDVERHRCGSCKGELKQIKPTPRTPAKPSNYQTFMKEQMRVLKKENPGSPQKEIMKMVAGEWSRRSAAVAANDQVRPGDDAKKPDDLTEEMERLRLGRDITP
jgi:predicted SprT family Zn-dependent metalloprotease